MPDTDAEATARAEEDPMGLGVLDAVDVGGTWTVTGATDTAPPSSPQPAAPASSPDLAERPSELAERPPAPPPNPGRPAPRWQPVQAAGAGKGRWLIAAVIVAAVIATVPLAVAAGTFAYRVANSPVPRVSAAPVRYLAAASPTRIEAAAVARGLRCATQPRSAGGTTTVRTCQPAPDAGAASGVGVAAVAMVGNDSGHLLAVSAVSAGGEVADEPAGLALLQAIVGATVARRDAAADDAWLRAHFDQSGDSQTAVHGVSLRLAVHGSSRSLVILPAY